MTKMPNKETPDKQPSVIELEWELAGARVQQTEDADRIEALEWERDVLREAAKAMFKRFLDCPICLAYQGEEHCSEMLSDGTYIPCEVGVLQDL